MQQIHATPGWARALPDLTGRRVLVVGGSGGVGEGITSSLLRAGATVVATGRDASRLDQLAARSAAPRLETARLDALSPDLADELGAIAGGDRSLDAAVLSIASWGDQGRMPVLDLTDEAWAALLDANLTALFRLFRALRPLVVASGAFVQVNGMSADIPFPGAGAVAAGAAAAKSLTRTVAVELAQAGGARVYELVLGVVRTRARQAQGIDDQRWLDAVDIGAHVAALVAGSSPLAGTTLQYLTDRTLGPQADPPRPGS